MTRNTIDWGVKPAIYNIITNLQITNILDQCISNSILSIRGGNCELVVKGDFNVDSHRNGP